MQKVFRNQPHLPHARFVLMGIALGAVFWMLEAAVHVLVFHDVGFFEQVFSPEPHEVWMRLTIVAMFIGFGIYSQWIVTARWRAERAAMRANMELTQIFDTAADAMRVVDKDFNVIRVNETFSAISGIAKGEAVGKKCHEVFWGPLCHTKDCPLIRILGNVDRVECDSEKVRKDGVKIPCIVTATPFRGPDGELIGIVEDFKDISERKESEQSLMQSHKRLRDLTSHLQVVREEERALIAREIHDELGQALTALKMDVHWLRRRLSEEKQSLIDKTNIMSKLIDRTVQSVRRICSELRPGLLDDFGLSAAIEWEAGEFSKRTAIECEILSDPEEMVLPQGISTAVFRIFQETLTNITRHANATKVEIILRRNRGRLEMRVSDNGKGIKEQEILNPKSFGIIGMRERVHYLVGNLSIRGNHNGTIVAVSIPVGPEGDIDDKDTNRG
ncbi:MAG: PAS domain S-box protein [Deltaproteobacteria bacterium]|nr:PAS domain S-box protein [Deltaproteobacteria bacterium]